MRRSPGSPERSARALPRRAGWRRRRCAPRSSRARACAACPVGVTSGKAILYPILSGKTIQSQGRLSSRAGRCFRAAKRSGVRRRSQAPQVGPARVGGWGQGVASPYSCPSDWSDGCRRHRARHAPRVAQGTPAQLHHTPEPRRQSDTPAVRVLPRPRLVAARPSRARPHRRPAPDERRARDVSL